MKNASKGFEFLQYLKSLPTPVLDHSNTLKVVAKNFLKKKQTNSVAWQLF